MLIRLFSRLFLRLLVLCALLCAVVPLIGARSPIPDDAWLKFGFGYCALPCFAGITPGQTPFSEVPNLLARHVSVIDPRLISGGASITFWAQTRNRQFDGLVRYDHGLVGEMRLNVVLPVDQIIEDLGAPDCILINAGGDAQQSNVVFWERGAISIGAVLPPQEHVLNLGTLAQALWLRDVKPQDCSLRGAIPWRGFAATWAYQP